MISNGKRRERAARLPIGGIASSEATRLMKTICDGKVIYTSWIVRSRAGESPAFPTNYHD